MTKPFQVPAEPARIEITVVNSRFIATLEPVFSVEEAKAFISRIRKEFPDASHNVPAYLVGGGDSVISHCSDDGEPSGTAGRPALAVLSGSGLGDVAVVVTRYFGGTKLGTGGLVRAYSEAVRQVIKVTPRAEKILTSTAMVELPYRLLERLRLLVPAHKGVILEEEFGEQVILTVRFPSENMEDFQKALSELSNGALEALILEQKEILMRVASEPK